MAKRSGGARARAIALNAALFPAALLASAVVGAAGFFIGLWSVLSGWAENFLEGEAKPW